MLKTSLATAALAAAALGLSACGTTGTAALQATFAHLETCDRHYTGSFGTGIPSGTVQIDCKAQAPTPASVAALGTPPSAAAPAEAKTQASTPAP